MTMRPSASRLTGVVEMPSATCRPASRSATVVAASTDIVFDGAWCSPTEPPISSVVLGLVGETFRPRDWPRLL